MTGPRVLRGRETSMLWFGISGVWIARGVLGMTPKLEERVTKLCKLVRRQDFTCIEALMGFNGFYSTSRKQFFLLLLNEVTEGPKVLNYN